MTQTPMIVDLSHDDRLPSGGFAALKDAGIVGVILKATQGSTFIDPMYASRYSRALTVFGTGCVHSYHFLDGSDPGMQVNHFVEVTAGKPGRWLDYEQYPKSQCSQDQFLSAVRTLHAKQQKWPGVYGSDKDLLGAALDAGHCSHCGKWIARDDTEPSHHWDIWQYVAGETKQIALCGQYYDLNVFNGSADECRVWMRATAW